MSAERGKEFAQRMRMLRKRAGLAESALVEAIYADPKFQWEARKIIRGDWYGGLDLAQAVRLADALGCSLDEIAGRHFIPSASADRERGA